MIEHDEGTTFVLVPPSMVAGVHVGCPMPGTSLPVAVRSEPYSSRAATTRAAPTTALTPPDGSTPACDASPVTVTSGWSTPAAAYPTPSTLPSTMA